MSTSDQNNTFISAEAVEALFNSTFESHNTILKGGASEPLYTPSINNHPSVLTYRENFVSSALHEIAHWCIAGERRRRMVDFGYFYAPEGRSVEQQNMFFEYEVKPQALEWIFSDALNVEFNFSVDNFIAELQAREAIFKEDVTRQKLAFLGAEMPQRAKIFLSACPLYAPPLQIEKDAK